MICQDKSGHTASNLWATGAIELAVASQRLEIAFLISIMTFLTLRFLKPVAAIDHDEERTVKVLRMWTHYE